MSKAISVALVGADTPAAQTVLDVLVEMPIQLGALYPLADDEEAGTLELNQQVLPILDLETFDFAHVDAALFVGEPALATRYAAQAASAGVAVIDLTGGANAPVGAAKRGQVVSLPQVVTSMITAALDALKTAAAPEFVAASALLSASGEGKNAIETLSMQTRQLFAQQEVELGGYPKRLAFNLLPVTDAEAINRVQQEVAAAGLPLHSLTLTHAPVFFGHAVSLSVRLAQPQTRAQIEAALQASPALFFLQVDGAAGIATPQDAIGADKIWANQLQVSNDGLTVTLWLVADNARLPARAAALLLALL
ncbi:Asd/ArgC dimerization domain-containing protein [Chitinibacter sp. ZOR0017]|uniref:Asd/ArgC dimerization domain-containing protein n=1 Tax=Chitinibacter sp. ZOR0017 TaxID=1339254 RepID=UPI000648A221|nr:Asd/ArgC dimerization domain-containing protein [Chitinibacter sp. ZOR0017]